MRGGGGDEVVTKYYYAAGQRVAMRQGGVVYYLHTDHPSAGSEQALGSASLATTSSGAVHSQQRYYPYGGARWTSGTLPTDRRFTGQRLEAGLGLYDYHARFYDPTLGRFISADTIVPNPGNPQDLNRYTYAANNPLRYVDPTGHWYGPDDYDPAGIETLEERYAFAEMSGDESILRWYGGTDEPPFMTLEGAASLALDFMPGVGDAKGFVEVFTGEDLVTGESLGAWRWLGLVALAELRHIRYADEALDGIANALPGTRRFARAVPERVARDIAAGLDDVYLAKPRDPDVFITAAEDLARYRSQSSVERRLALPPGRRAVVTFNLDVDVAGIASPIRRNYPEFVGGGRTRGGAREWVIPNRPLNELPIWNIKVRHLK